MVVFQCYVSLPEGKLRFLKWLDLYIWSKQSFGPHVFKSCSRDHGGCSFSASGAWKNPSLHTMNGAMNGVISPGSYEKSTSSRGIFVILYALSLTKYFTRW